MLENQVNLIHIGIGSNLGNKINNIEKAKFLISLNKINIIKTSSYYETLSWPDPTKPKFLNVVVSIKSNLSPKKLLKSKKTCPKCTPLGTSGVIWGDLRTIWSDFRK